MAQGDFEQTIFGALSDSNTELQQCLTCPLRQGSRLKGILDVVLRRCDWTCSEGPIPTRIVENLPDPNPPASNDKRNIFMAAAAAGILHVPAYDPTARTSIKSVIAEDCGRLAAQFDDETHTDVIKNLAEYTVHDHHGFTISRQQLDGKSLPPLRPYRKLE